MEAAAGACGFGCPVAVAAAGSGRQSPVHLAVAAAAGQPADSDCRPFRSYRIERTIRFLVDECVLKAERD